MNRYILSLFVLTMSSLLSGQTAPAPAPVTEKKVSSTGFALANNFFGLNLLNKLSEQNEQGEASNVFFSPYSISLALAMLYQGTGGSTSQQLESSLGYELVKLNGTDKSQLTQQIKATDDVILLPQNLPNNVTKYVLNSGNALIANKQFPILETYTKNLQNNFRAELFPVDFANAAQEALTLINQWVSNRTNGKIPTLLTKPLPAETQLALVNAVYFQGTWETLFDPFFTYPSTFTGLNESVNDNVTFMNINDRFKFAKLDKVNATLVELPYKGGDLSLYALLPNDEKSDLKLVKQKLTPTFIDSTITQLREQKIQLQFPKFDFKTEYDLVENLKALGITEIFDGSKADFTGITSSGNKLAVGMVKHSATIEVNERGSEASAATIIEGVVTLPSLVRQIEIQFTHPFLFFIRHNVNGLILFIGEVNKL